MTREKLLETKRTLETQRDQLSVNLNAIAGGLQTIEYLLAEDDKESKPVQDTPAVKFEDLKKSIETGEPLYVSSGAISAIEPVKE